MTDTAQQPPEVDPLQVRTSPAGLTRAERRDWREGEALRIAALQDERRDGAGFRAVTATAPPRRLGRRGRAAWREADRENRAARMKAEAARAEPDRAAGLLLVLVLAAAVVAAWHFLGPDADTTPPPAPTATQSTPIVSPQSATSAVQVPGPLDAVRAWYALVCPSTADHPQSARLARSRPMMTRAGWAAVDHAPTPAGATWSCSNITATLGPATTDQAVVYYSADVTGPLGTHTRQEARTVDLSAGVWLVGPLTTTAG